MSVEQKYITGLVDTGIFYVRDAAFYHFCRKDSILLEDMTYYSFALPRGTTNIRNLKVLDESGEQDLNIGWGYNYGVYYGGYPRSGQSSISISLAPNNSGVKNPITSTSRITYDADIAVDKPTRTLLDYSAVDQELEISFLSEQGYPNCFGINDRNIAKLEVDTSTGIDINGTAYLSADDVTVVILNGGDLTFISSTSYDLSTDKALFISDLTAAPKSNIFIIYSSGDLVTNGVSDPDVVDVLESVQASSTTLGALTTTSNYLLVSIPASGVKYETSSPSDIVIEDFKVESERLYRSSDVNNKFLVEVKQLSPYDADGNMLDLAQHAYSYGTDTTQAFSLDFTRNTVTHNKVYVDLYLNSSQPIPLQTNQQDLLEFLRTTDVLWLEYRINIINIKSSNDLPSPSNTDEGDVFFITDPADPFANTYFVLDSANAFQNKPSIPRQSNSAFQLILQEVPSTPGEIRNVNTIYVTPANPTGLAADLIDFFDGIPAGSRLYTNQQVLIVSQFEDNKLLLAQGIPDKTTTTAYEFPLDGKQVLYLDGMLLATAPVPPTVTLFGQGMNFTEDIPIYLWQTKKEYVLPNEYVSNEAPIIVTDLLASAQDLDEFTNHNFRVEGSNLVFGGTPNLLADPSFLYSGYGWNVEGTVEYPYDADKVTSLLHERSCRLVNLGSTIRQHVPGIDAELNYSLSFYGKSNLGEIRVNIIQLKNSGSPLDTSPTVLVMDGLTLGSSSWYNPLETYTLVGPERYIQDTTEFEVLGYSTYEPYQFGETFERVVARLYRFLNFNKSDVTEMVLDEGLSALDPDCTDIIIEIENATSGAPVFIDCVKFEQSNNPTNFRHNYDICVVEYETMDKVYAPRFLLSSNHNRLNNGFLSIYVEEEDFPEFTPDELLVYNTRSSVRQRINSRYYGKMDGKDKLSHVANIDREHKPFLGEYFLFPPETKPRYISFIPDPLEVSLDSVEEAAGDNAIYGVVEDELFNNLPGKMVKFEYGLRPGQMQYSSYEETEDDGTFVLPIPRLLQEQVNPLYDLTVGGGIVEEYSSYTPVANEHYCVFDKTGDHSAVLDYLGNVVAGEAHGTPSNDYVLIIPIVNSMPKGFIKWPLERQYDLELKNNSSAVISFVSALTGEEIQLSTYSSEDYTSTVVNTTTDGLYSYATLSPNLHNPMEGSFYIRETNNPLADYREVYKTDLIGNQFYFDRATSRLVINNPNVTSITVYYLEHLAFIKPTNLREIFLSHKVFLKIIQTIAYEISTSSLHRQGTETFASTFGISPLHPLSVPLKLRVSANCNLYIEASTGSARAASKITYLHKKALV